MKKVSLIFAISLCLLTSFMVNASGNERSKDLLLENQLQSLKSEKFTQFIEHGTTQFKMAMKESQFKQVSNALHEQLAGNYKVEYLGELNQQKYKVYLWKLSYEEGDDDNLVKLVLDGNKIAGFWIQ